MRLVNTKKDYQKYVDKKSPNSPIFKNCFNSFIVGGFICVVRTINNGNMQIQRIR